MKKKNQMNAEEIYIPIKKQKLEQQVYSDAED
jgi:hypothetical protein